jgi:hypothetical protein
MLDADRLAEGEELSSNILQHLRGTSAWLGNPFRAELG